MASKLQLLPLSLALIPLIITPGLLFYFDVTPKVIVLLVSTALALVAVETNAQGVRAIRVAPHGRWLIYLSVGQAASIVISTAFSQDVWLSVTGSNWRRCGAIVELGMLVFAILLAARVANNRKTAQVVMRCIAFACVLTSIYGIAQFGGIDWLLPADSYHAGEGIWTIIRTPSTLGNANFFANYLVFASFCSAALIRRDSRVLWSWLGAAACGTAMIAIVLSGTRSAILGLITGLAVLAISANSSRRYWIIGAGVCTAAFIALLAMTQAGLPLKARIRWSKDDALGGGRLLLWRDTVKLIGSRPLTGFGPESFGRSFPPFQSVELAQTHPDFYQESPHNAFLDVAAANGILGLFFAVGLLGLGFYAAWGARYDEPTLSFCLMAALAGGSTCALFSPPVLVTCLYPLALIAMLCALECHPVPEQNKVSAVVRYMSWSGASIFLVFSFLLLLNDGVAGSFRRAILSGNVPMAIQRYETIRNLWLPGFNIDLYASRVLARAQAWPAAMDAAERAVRTAEDRQNAFFNLAQLRALRNDVPGTEQSLRSASRVAPNWFKPHWILAELFMRTGRVDGAREEARVAMKLDAGKDPEVVRTWRALGSPR